MGRNQISEDDVIVLIPLNKGSKITLKIEGRSRKIHGLGVYNSSKLIGRSYGSTITLGRNKYWLLPATSLDCINTLNRKAQIILPKDAALLGLYCDLKPGSRVVEGGVGSGALSIMLLTIVGTTGRVTTYETRKEFAKVATDNIKNANLADVWELRMNDISLGISEKDIDAVILDIPEPWHVVNHAYNALRPGGSIASYLPTMNQVEKFVNTVRKKNFIESQTFETLHRGLVVGSGGTRPSYDMLGHSGYISVARKVLGDVD